MRPSDPPDPSDLVRVLDQDLNLHLEVRERGANTCDEVADSFPATFTAVALSEELVYAIKAGRHEAATGREMARLADALRDRGAEAVIAGCTEIPLVLGQEMLSIPLISSTDVLARATVAHAIGNEQ